MKNETFKLFIPGPLPGLNELIDAAKKVKGTWFGYGNTKYIWSQSICLHIRENYKKIPRPISYPVWIEFTWLEPNKKRDPDNISSAGRKIILDCLIKEKILENDGWNQITGWTDTFRARERNPGVWLCLTKAK